jgi:hypothetical protein
MRSRDAAGHSDETRANPSGLSPFGGEYCAVSGKFGPSIGAIFNPRRTSLHLLSAILDVDGAILEILTRLDNLGICMLEKVRGR